MLPRVKFHLATAVTAIAALIAAGTGIFHILEDWSIVDSFYFSVMTITTVGYGDFFPTHDVSKIFTAIYAIAGVSIAFASLGAIGAAYLEAREHRHLAKRESRQ
jgi:hypothetical protein